MPPKDSVVDVLIAMRDPVARVDNEAQIQDLASDIRFEQFDLMQRFSNDFNQLVKMRFKPRSR
jgi:hypothetical protein